MGAFSIHQGMRSLAVALPLLLVAGLTSGCLSFWSESDPCGKSRHIERYEDEDLAESYDHTWTAPNERMFAWYLDLENVCARSHVQLRFQSLTEEITHDPTVVCGAMDPTTWGNVDWGLVYEDGTEEKGAGRYDEGLEIGLKQAFPSGPAMLHAEVVISVIDEGDLQSTAICMDEVTQSVAIIADYKEYRA